MIGLIDPRINDPDDQKPMGSNALVEGVEALDWLRYLMAELDYRKPDPGKLRKHDPDVPLRGAVVFSDAKSLVDVLKKDTGHAADKRVRVVVAQLKQFQDSSVVSVRWLDTRLMLADALTKEGVERGYLLAVLESNRWSPSPTEETVMAKVAIRAGRHARAEVRRATKAASRAAFVATDAAWPSRRVALSLCAG